MNDKFLRSHRLPEITGLSLSSLYRLIRRGEFPPPVRLSAQAVGWAASDVERWIESRKEARQ